MVEPLHPELAPPRPILRVRDLRCAFHTPGGDVIAVDGADFDLLAGDTLGIVGESGSGKSVTALSLLGLNDPSLCAVSGSIELDGRELTGLSEVELGRVRGREIAMIFQDPMSSLNPFLRVGRQLTEVLEVHEGASRADARRRAIEILERVGIADADRRIDQYPHQLSGGMRQRVMIAMALLCRPKVLIADEPTTALDVTIQAQILDLIKGLSADFGTAVIFITHDLGVIAGLADEVLVMYAGRVVERAGTLQLFDEPQHPYTQGLLASIPRLDRTGDLLAIPGRAPMGLERPTGCAFHPRCAVARASCANDVPGLIHVESGWQVACPWASRLPLPDARLPPEAIIGPVPEMEDSLLPRSGEVDTPLPTLQRNEQPPEKAGPEHAAADDDDADDDDAGPEDADDGPDDAAADDDDKDSKAQPAEPADGKEQSGA